jgi:hypothetical protein
MDLSLGIYHASDSKSAAMAVCRTATPQCWCCRLLAFCRRKKKKKQKH